MTIEYLLRRATRVSASADRGDRQALDMALHALQAMAKGGMYDVVGGGFARYSTDDLWRTPHFEKMLYDNAQLARVYLHAWLVCREDARRGCRGEAHVGAQGMRRPYRRRPYDAVCEQTLDFVLREMTHPLGGFYSSLDADSEGEWRANFTSGRRRRSRLPWAMPSDADFVIAAYQVTEARQFRGQEHLAARPQR